MRNYFFICFIFFSLITFSCKRAPQDSRLPGEWVANHIDNNGNDVLASIFFVFNGNLSYSRGHTTWLGMWSTKNGVLNLSFEDSSINGTYNYKVKRYSQNTAASKPFDELQLETIEIDDSLYENQLTGSFNSLY